jgi:hypothetical protein
MLVIYHSVSNNQPLSGLTENQKHSQRQVGWRTEVDAEKIGVLPIPALHCVAHLRDLQSLMRSKPHD